MIPHKPVKRLRVHEKYKLVNSPGSQRSLVKQFEIGNSTVAMILKNKAEII